MLRPLPLVALALLLAAPGLAPAKGKGPQGAAPAGAPFPKKGKAPLDFGQPVENLGTYLQRELGEELFIELARQATELGNQRAVALEGEHFGGRSADVLNLDPKLLLIVPPSFSSHGGVYSAGPIVVIGSQGRTPWVAEVRSRSWIAVVGQPRITGRTEGATSTIRVEGAKPATSAAGAGGLPGAAAAPGDGGPPPGDRTVKVGKAGLAAAVAQVCAGLPAGQRGLVEVGDDLDEVGPVVARCSVTIQAARNGTRIGPGGRLQFRGDGDLALAGFHFAGGAAFSVAGKLAIFDCEIDGDVALGARGGMQMVRNTIRGDTAVTLGGD